MSEWQPIETAPEGIPILVWDGESISLGQCENIKYNRWVAIVNGSYAWYGDGDTGGLLELDKKPTHWMFLPEPPRE